MPNTKLRDGSYGVSSISHGCAVPCAGRVRKHVLIRADACMSHIGESYFGFFHASCCVMACGLCIYIYGRVGQIPCTSSAAQHTIESCRISSFYHTGFRSFSLIGYQQGLQFDFQPTANTPFSQNPINSQKSKTSSPIWPQPGPTGSRS